MCCDSLGVDWLYLGAASIPYVQNPILKLPNSYVTWSSFQKKKTESYITTYKPACVVHNIHLLHFLTSLASTYVLVHCNEFAAKLQEK